MIVVGLLCLLFGFLLKIALVWTIGIVLVIVGAIFAVAGRTGHPVGRQHYW